MTLSLYCRQCGTRLPADSLFCHACSITQTGTDHTLTSPSQQEFALLGTGRQPTGRMLRQRYRLLQTLGKGGMGAVYLAQDTQLDRRVAVKELSLSRVPLPEISQAVEQFRNEAHLLASLDHPNLPVIHEYFSEGERWYLVMSFIEGQTLQATLNATPGNKLPTEKVVHIGLELCEVLEYLHTHNPQIIFRDLKPSNIMLTPKGHICLIDFGIARHFKRAQTKDTAYYYTVGYAPPEQYGQSQTSPRSDIYSLGATLHQLLSGHKPNAKPFQFTLLHLVDPTLPEPLTALIAQMLEMDEQARPESVTEVKVQLERVLISQHLASREKADAQQAEAQSLPPQPSNREPTAPTSQPNTAKPSSKKMRESLAHPETRVQTPSSHILQPLLPQPPTRKAKTFAKQRVALLTMAGLVILILISGIFWFSTRHITPTNNLASYIPIPVGRSTTHPPVITGIMTEFSIHIANSEPNEITTGPDGNLWFTESTGNNISRITPQGTVIIFPLPTPQSNPAGISTGPDGKLWFTESAGNKIGRITPQGSITEFPLPTPNSAPGRITIGPDHNLWFTERNGDKIGRITPQGSITEFPLPTPNSTPEGITTGPDNYLWFTEYSGNKIGRITPQGSITEFLLPTPNSISEGIVTGPDGDLWFTEFGGKKIGRITLSGTITEFSLPGLMGRPYGITTGPDHNLWFTEFDGNKVDRISLQGLITEFPLPTADRGPHGITLGPDGNLWFTEYTSSQIGRITSGQ